MTKAISFINRFRNYYYSDDGAWLEECGKFTSWILKWFIVYYVIAYLMVPAFAFEFVKNELPQLCQMIQK